MDALIAGALSSAYPVVEFSLANKNSEATELLLKPAAPLQKIAPDTADEFIKLQIKYRQDAQIAAQSSCSCALTLLIVLGEAAIALRGALGWLHEMRALVLACLP